MSNTQPICADDWRAFLRHLIVQNAHQRSRLSQRRASYAAASIGSQLVTSCHASKAKV
ncbi:hypothetical protein SAMN05414138_10215 [Rhodoplanes sp. JGI PP 4-B12]|nr:hypothetical protein SAMN05414138_10215 [Rhodoplanes sp. JGI PP 4-B12]